MPLTFCKVIVTVSPEFKTHRRFVDKIEPYPFAGKLGNWGLVIRE